MNDRYGIALGFGVLLIILGITSPFVGCFGGIQTGYRAANGPAPVGPAVLYNNSDPPDTMHDFWIVQYPRGQGSEQLPRLIRLNDPDFADPGWHAGPPQVMNRLNLGPWESPPPWSDNPSEEWGQPTGDIQISAGGVSFESTDSDTILVRLIIYPSGKSEGWSRWFYVYEISKGKVQPVKAYREYDTSDWTGEGVIVYGLFGLVVGLVIGVIFILVGSLLVFCRSKKHVVLHHS